MNNSAFFPLSPSSRKFVHKNANLRTQSSSKLYRILTKPDHLSYSLSSSQVSPLHETEAQKRRRQIEQYKRNRDMNKILQLFNDKINLLHELKQQITRQRNSIFEKNIMSQIRYLGAGRVLIKLWEQSEYYRQTSQKMIIDLEHWGKFVVNEDFLKALDTANNIYMFMLTEYKQKKWRDRYQSICFYSKCVNKSLENIGKKVYKIDSKAVRQEFNKTLANIQKQKGIAATKKHYMKLKSEGNDLLLQQAHGCKILRAQIFTQKFYDIGFE